MTRQERRLLITGCGRSGTKFIAAVLQNHGLDVRHERMGADGTASWCMAVESSDSPWGGGRRGIRFNTALHQVRHPLRVIPSLSTFTASSWEFIEHHIPCPKSDPILLRAAKYWYYWNLEAERIAQWRYRLETLPSIFEEFCEQIGIEPQRSALESTSTMVNSRKFRRGLRRARDLFDHFGLETSSRKFDFLYNPRSTYVDAPFNWEALEQHAPGWSKRIRDVSRRYGYTVQDDVTAAGITSNQFKDVQDATGQPI